MEHCIIAESTPLEMYVKETTLYVPASDGQLIALHYYAGYRGPMRRGPLPLPVLCVHGLGANRHNFDIFGDPGALPRQLAARGHDTYVIELRGMGHSHAEQHGVDDYLGLDLPAVVDYILQGRGLRERKLHWIGHSLGAILGYLYGGAHPEKLASLTSVAGPLPAAVPIFARNLLAQARHFIRGGLENLMLPNRRGALAFKHLPKLARLAYAGRLFHGPNLSDELLVKVADQCLENVSLGVLRRLAEWTTTHGPHAHEIEDALRTLTVPALYLAGVLDPLAPPVACEAAMQHMPEGYGTFRVVSKRRGDGADFGHGDILVSPAAQRAVYPLIIDFITARDAPAKALQAAS